MNTRKLSIEQSYILTTFCFRSSSELPASTYEPRPYDGVAAGHVQVISCVCQPPAVFFNRLQGVLLLLTRPCLSLSLSLSLSLCVCVCVCVCVSRRQQWCVPQWQPWGVLLLLTTPEPQPTMPGTNLFSLI